MRTKKDLLREFNRLAEVSTDFPVLKVSLEVLIDIRDILYANTCEWRVDNHPIELDGESHRP
jgi:hypothetical protein